MKTNTLISGPQGSGKSTLAKQLIDGRKFIELTPNDLKNTISIRNFITEDTEVILIDGVTEITSPISWLLNNSEIKFRKPYMEELTSIPKPGIIVLTQNPKIEKLFEKFFHKIISLGDAKPKEQFTSELRCLKCETGVIKISAEFHGTHSTTTIQRCSNPECRHQYSFEDIMSGRLSILRSVQLFDINEPDFYQNSKPEFKERTKKRLTEMANLGMQKTGVASFGIPNVMSGLYIEKVWGYDDVQFQDYMDWVRSLILAKK